MPNLLISALPGRRNRPWPGRNWKPRTAPWSPRTFRLSSPPCCCCNAARMGAMPSAPNGCCRWRNTPGGRLSARGRARPWLGRNEQRWRDRPPAILARPAWRSARERVIDPGEDIVRARLSDPMDGAISPECKGAINRWYRQMTMTEIRCAIELRADESRQSPGRVVGTLMEYETRAGDRPEMFAPGSLEWPADGILLNLSHDRKQPVMRFKPGSPGQRRHDRRGVAGHGPRARRGDHDPQLYAPRLVGRIPGLERGNARWGSPDPFCRLGGGGISGFAKLPVQRSRGAPARRPPPHAALVVEGNRWRKLNPSSLRPSPRTFPPCWPKAISWRRSGPGIDASAIIVLYATAPLPPSYSSGYFQAAPGDAFRFFRRPVMPADMGAGCPGDAGRSPGPDSPDRPARIEA